MKKILLLALTGLLAFNVLAQTNVENFTRKDIMKLTYDELLEMPLDQVLKLAAIMGVSSDELFEMIMNKSVSSASKKEESSFTSPLSSTVITRDEMRTYGISSIEEAFRLIPGMIVTEKTNGVYDIQMRGLNNIPDNNMFLYSENNNALIMVDGRPVQNYAMGAVNFDMIPIDIEDVERIEVVRGAASALYGANAVSGVINIITEKPNENSKLVSGSFQAGSQNTYVGNLGVRKAFNSKIAAGATFNFQYRERPTDKLYVIPGQAGLYYNDNEALMPAAGEIVKTPYTYGSLDEKGVLTLNGVGSVQLDADKNPVLSSLTLEEGKTADDFKSALNNFMLSYLQHQTIFSGLTEVFEGGYYSVDQIDHFKQIYPNEYDANGNIVSYRLFDAKEPETPGSQMFPHPEIARRNIGINAYLRYTPIEQVAINFTAGYQNSYVNTTPVGDDFFSFNGRTSKTAYAAVDASIYGLKLLANYCGGPQEYAVGVPGFKVYPKTLNLSAEYDFNFDFGLSVRPGISYQNVLTEDYSPIRDSVGYGWSYADPGYRYDENDPNHLSGFFNYTCKMTTFAPSIRLDYKVGDFRFIAAFREDKTNIPDKWTPSWQLAANYNINENNFVRVVYGRANRGTNMVSCGSNFDWTRTNMVYPYKLHFAANEDPALVKIDNFEVGYRTKPSDKLLIDAEVFYSISSDFGALMANTAAMQINKANAANIAATMASGLKIYEDLYGGKEGLVAAVAQNPNLMKEALQKMLSGSGDNYQAEGFDMGMIMQPYASIKYQKLPYKVKQLGVSLNVDYIISPKLIAKMNANYQNTTIDNYYEYSQTNDIMAMLTETKTKASAELSQDFANIFNNYLVGGMDIQTSISNVLSSRLNGSTYDFGNTAISHDDSSTPKENGVKHEATPTFYGMVGLIYKPITKLEISAFANYIGKRTYKLMYGSTTLNDRCTVNMKVGYKPIQNVEVFVNAHNLFNTKQREFTCSDEIGGIYTAGVTFNF